MCVKCILSAMRRRYFHKSRLEETERETKRGLLRIFPLKKKISGTCIAKVVESRKSEQGSEGGE